MISESELETELAQINERIEKISNSYDDTADEVEMIYMAVYTALPEGLIDLILEYAVVENGTITFHLPGGLYFEERLCEA